MELNAVWFAMLTFAGILVFTAIGNLLGTAALARNPPGENRGISTIEGALFGLLGLMIAFTFSGAATRFEDRRHLITEEANAIGTAWLRIDTLPAVTQPALRELFLQYLDNRAVVYRGNKTADDRTRKLQQTNALQQAIWDHAIAATRSPGASNQTAMLLLPALNEMIDITTTRQVATVNHPPLVIYLLLELLAFITAFIAGYGIAGNSPQARMHKLVFALLMSLTLLVTIDLEYPRKGFVRIDDADQPIIDLRDSLRKKRDNPAVINAPRSQ